MNLDIKPEHWSIIKNILSQYPYHFYAFGSRTKNSAKQYSDFDLCYKENIPDHIIAHIEEQLEESNLPFKVEFVSWHRCSSDFQKLIEKDLTLLDLS